MYLLDTNACVRILNNTSAPLIARMRRHSPGEIQLCSVVKAELIYGAYRSSRVAENLRLLQRFFDPFASLPFDDVCAQQHGHIRDELQRGGTPIGPNDLMIASIAVANDLILITNNTREFARVVGLRLEDWERNQDSQQASRPFAASASGMAPDSTPPQCGFGQFTPQAPRTQRKAK